MLALLFSPPIRTIGFLAHTYSCCSFSLSLTGREHRTGVFVSEVHPGSEAHAQGLVVSHGNRHTQTHKHMHDSFPPAAAADASFCYRFHHRSAAVVVCTFCFADQCPLALKLSFGLPFYFPPLIFLFDDQTPLDCHQTEKTGDHRFLIPFLI